MRQQYLLSICVFLLSVIGLSATDALAQFSVFGGRGGRPGGGVGGARGIEPPLQGSGSRNERRITAPEADSYEQIEYRLSTLHDELKLTPAQDMAWQAFATKTRAWAADIARERARNMRSSSSVVLPNGQQHVTQAVDTVRNRLAALEEVEASVSALYPGLTSEQQALADLRIPLIIAPRPSGFPGVAGDVLPDLGSGSRPSR